MKPEFTTVEEFIQDMAAHAKYQKFDNLFDLLDFTNKYYNDFNLFTSRKVLKEVIDKLADLWDEEVSDKQINEVTDKILGSSV